MPDDTFVIALDGITVQHAGELLYDTAVDSSVRAACVDSYLQSLGDVAFAVLCGDRFATSARMPHDPNHPEHTPAGDIVKDAFADRLVEIQGVAPAENILQDPKRAQAVAKDTQYLMRALDERRLAWEDFMRRETVLYMGNDESLRRDGLDREQYKFAAKHYIARPELQDLVPASYTAALMPIVKESAANVVSETATREFITRVAVTHILFYWDNENAAEDIVQQGGTRLPHETRALLRKVQAEGESPERVLRRAVTPHALKYVLKRSESRRDVIERLQDFHQDRLFRKVRGLLQEALVEHDLGNDKKLRTLLDNLEKVVRESDAPADQVTMKPKIEVGFPGGMKLGFEMTWEYIINHRRYWIRQLVHAGAGSELRALAAKVFPEFRPRS